MTVLLVELKNIINITFYSGFKKYCKIIKIKICDETNCVNVKH
jgi:hypothetical protein